MKLGRQSIPSNKRKGVLSRPKSRAHANVVGYEKRLARKALKKSNNPITDLYEHAQVPEKKARRSKVTLDLGSDEEFEIRDGEGDEGDDDERERLKARLIGENEDDEKIDSDDDEELDSDAAFEESDEERFEEFSRARHTTRMRNFLTRNLQVLTLTVPQKKKIWILTLRMTRKCRKL
jgi:hypothetical protein